MQNFPEENTALAIQNEFVIFIVIFQILLFGLTLLLKIWYLPLLSISGLLVVCLSIIYPEIPLISFVFITITKQWIAEYIPIFKSIDYTVFLLIYLLFVCGIRYLIYGNFSILPIGKFIWPLILFSFWIFITLSYTPEFKDGAAKAVRFSIFNIPLFFLTITLVQTKKSLKRVIHFFIAAALFFSVIMIYQGITNLFSGNLLLYVVRLSVLGANPIASARIFSVAFAMLFVIFYFEPGKRIKFFYLIILCLLAAALIVTQSRGPLVSVLGAIMIFLYFYSGKRKSIVLVNFFAVFILFLGILLILPGNLTERYLSVFGGQSNLSMYLGQGSGTITEAIRIEFWSRTIIHSFDSAVKFFIGHGSNAFRALFPFYTNAPYPHNILIEILYEFGAIGLVIFGWHLSQIENMARKTLKITKSKIEGYRILVIFIIAATTAFFSVMFSGDLTENRYLWFFFGLIIACGRVFLEQEGSNYSSFQSRKSFLPET